MDAQPQNAQTLTAMELLLSRRSCVVRAMTGPGPTAAELEEILTAGIRVPDHGKIFPWRIQIIDDAGQVELGRLCAELFAADNPDATAEQIDMERQRPSRAPVLLSVANRINREHPKVPAVEQLLSGGAVCQNLLIAAHAKGYVAQWLTEWPAYRDEIKRALGHSPEADIIGWIYIGSATETPTERRRASVSEVVSSWSKPGDRVAEPAAR